MRVSRSSSAAASATLLVWLVPLAYGISVPTGKLTPITPARSTPRYVNPRAPANPAAVVEYSEEHPEPAPLDPSYVPVTYNYFDTLARHHVYYVPVRYRNFNGVDSNSIDYEAPQKHFGQTLGKNILYKPYKQRVPYFPPKPVHWGDQGQYTKQYKRQDNQYNSQNQQFNQNQQLNNQNQQFNNQNQQFNNQNQQYTNQNQQFNSQNQQYTNQNQQYNNQNNNINHEQYNAQPAQTNQQFEVVSTQAAPASSVSPQQPTTTVAQPAPSADYRKVDFSTGKGSYDVTGKGGSKSEYYDVASKDDWSKKSLYPKKVLDQGLTPRKYASHKY